MFIFGMALLFVSFALLVWNLFIKAGKDRLPPWLCFRLSNQAVSDDFPPGVVLTKRAAYLWLSGGFWGLGSVLSIAALYPEFVMRYVSILAAVQVVSTLAIFFLNLKTDRRRKNEKAGEAAEEGGDDLQD